MRIIATLAVCLTLAFGAACASSKESCAHTPATAAPAAGTTAAAPTTFDAAPAAGTQATCSTCQKAFTVAAETARSETAGQHRAFCCPDCKAAFDAKSAK